MTFGDSFFPSLTPAEIYQQLTEGPGPWRLRSAQENTATERDLENDRAHMIRSLAQTVRTGWQGDTSAGAYGAAMPLAEHALVNAEKLDRAQDLLLRQVNSFTTAVNSVRPVAEPPVSSMDEKFPFEVDFEKVVTEYQDSAQHNIAVFRTYDGASQYNETNMPQEFHNDVRGGGDVSVRAPADTIEVGDASPPRRDEPGDGGYGGRPDVAGPWPGGRPGPSGGPVTGWPSDDPGQPGAGTTTPADVRPAPAPAPAPAPGGGLPGFGGTPGTAAPGAAGLGAPGVGVGGLPVAGYAGGSPGAGGFGPRGGGEFGPRGGGAGVGGPPGRGPGVGAVPGEHGVGQRAVTGAAGGRGAGSGGGYGPFGAPAGRGRDDEDGEHQRKFLVEADAEGTFGSDVLTAPQVIGDDEYED